MFAVLLPLIPLTVLLSTKGLMFLLLSAYGGAMWTFLSGAPRVYTIMVNDLDDAKRFYEIYLRLPEAELPLHYYYGYEQTVGSFDPMYYQGDMASAYNYQGSSSTSAVADAPGLWYQLTENAQIHVIGGAPEANEGYGNEGFGMYPPSRPSDRPSGSTPRRRHVSFDRDGLKAILQYVGKQKIPHTVRTEKPLSFLIRDRNGNPIEFAEIDD